MGERSSVDENKRATIRRFAALGAAGSLARLAGGSARAEDGDLGSDSDAGTSDARAAILGYLSTMPGTHFSKIRDDLSLGTGETQHHLRRLVEAGAVESFRDGDYRRFVLAGRFSEFEMHALGYLRRETPRGMLVALLRDPTTSATAIADALEVSPPTVSKYARELEEVGLLTREGGYEVQRPETLLTLLVRYADSFGPDAATLADEADELVRYDP